MSGSCLQIEALVTPQDDIDGVEPGRSSIRGTAEAPFSACNAATMKKLTKSICSFGNTETPPTFEHLLSLAIRAATYIADRWLNLLRQPRWSSRVNSKP